MNEADHKAFEYWWDDVPKINFSGTESERNAAEAAWIAALAYYNTTTASVQNIIADEYLANVAELVEAVEAAARAWDDHDFDGSELASRLDVDIEHAADLAAKLKEQQNETK